MPRKGVKNENDGKAFHTYSAYGVGADVMLSSYRFLDLTPLGRQRYIKRMAMARHVRGTGSS
jgi:predicted dithiol-disulfide oxidoreductase (DUF899 family)